MDDVFDINYIFYIVNCELLGKVIQIIHSVSQACFSPLIIPGIMSIMLTVERHEK